MTSIKSKEINKELVDQRGNLPHSVSNRLAKIYEVTDVMSLASDKLAFPVSSRLAEIYDVTDIKSFASVGENIEHFKISTLDIHLEIPAGLPLIEISHNGTILLKACILETLDDLKSANSRETEAFFDGAQLVQIINGFIALSSMNNIAKLDS